jgi:hypothetical protein
MKAGILKAASTPGPDDVPTMNGGEKNEMDPENISPWRFFLFL